MDSQFLLRPDEECRAILGFWLAYACSLFPGVRVLSLTVMTNHFHMELIDYDGVLSEFIKAFLSKSGEDINTLRRRSGPVFEGRFHAAETLDVEAAQDRIIYALLNPVRAGLVQSHKQWPGLLVWGGAPGEQTFIHPFRMKHVREGRTWKRVPESRTLTIQPLPEAFDTELIKRSVESEEKRLRFDRLRRNSHVLGAKKVQLVDPRSRPGETSRRPAPLCHASDPESKRAFRSQWYDFVAAYRAASQAFRRGVWDVPFPEFTFRPGMKSNVGPPPEDPIIVMG